jgi:hypothetical protein
VKKERARTESASYRNSLPWRALKIEPASPQRMLHMFTERSSAAVLRIGAIAMSKPLLRRERRRNRSPSYITGEILPIVDGYAGG